MANHHTGLFCGFERMAKNGEFIAKEGGAWFMVVRRIGYVQG
jgi:hypothetical protein